MKTPSPFLQSKRGAGAGGKGLSRRLFKGVLAFAAGFGLLIDGCAKFPSESGGDGSTRVIFEFEMDGPINPNFVYIVAMNPSTEDLPTTTGPIPVIAPPWGNGFVEGNATHFVRWDTSQSPRYLIFRFTDASLINYIERGVPVNYLELEPNGKRLRFEIDLTQIAADKTEADSFRTLQVNFLTMDRVPQGSQTDKSWDALGNGNNPGEVNEFVNIPLKTSGVYDNRRFSDLEPRNDNPDPALDIVDWSVEVRLR